jgi:hypothetical protein
MGELQPERRAMRLWHHVHAAQASIAMSHAEDLAGVALDDQAGTNRSASRTGLCGTPIPTQLVGACVVSLIIGNILLLFIFTATVHSIHYTSGKVALGVSLTTDLTGEISSEVRDSSGAGAAVPSSPSLALWLFFHLT